MTFLFQARAFPIVGNAEMSILIQSNRRDFVPEHGISYPCRKIPCGTIHFIPSTLIWDVHYVGEITDDSPSILEGLIINQAIQGFLPN
jgi:hypothetical protein